MKGRRLPAHKVLAQVFLGSPAAQVVNGNLTDRAGDKGKKGSREIKCPQKLCGNLSHFLQLI